MSSSEPQKLIAFNKITAADRRRFRRESRQPTWKKDGFKNQKAWIDSMLSAIAPVRDQTDRMSLPSQGLRLKTKDL